MLPVSGRPPQRARSLTPETDEDRASDPGAKRACTSDGDYPDQTVACGWKSETSTTRYTSEMSGQISVVPPKTYHILSGTRVTFSKLTKGREEWGCGHMVNIQVVENGSEQAVDITGRCTLLAPGGSSFAIKFPLGDGPVNVILVFNNTSGPTPFRLSRQFHVRPALTPAATAHAGGGAVTSLTPRLDESRVTTPLSLPPPQVPMTAPLSPQMGALQVQNMMLCTVGYTTLGYRGSVGYHPFCIQFPSHILSLPPAVELIISAINPLSGQKSPYKIPNAILCVPHPDGTGWHSVSLHRLVFEFWMQNGFQFDSLTPDVHLIFPGGAQKKTVLTAGIIPQASLFQGSQRAGTGKDIRN